jgi:hypothetical protein
MWGVAPGSLQSASSGLVSGGMEKETTQFLQ